MIFHPACDLLPGANSPGLVSVFFGEDQAEMLLRDELKPVDFWNGKSIAKKRIVLRGHDRNEVYHDRSQITPH